MGIVVLGAVFVDIKGYPLSAYIPGGRNAGRIEQVHGGVSRNVVEDIANVELRPTFVSLVDDTGMGQDVINKLENHKVNTKYIQRVPDGMGYCGAKVHSFTGTRCPLCFANRPGKLLARSILRSHDLPVTVLVFQHFDGLSYFRIVQRRMTGDSGLVMVTQDNLVADQLTNLVAEQFEVGIFIVFQFFADRVEFAGDSVEVFFPLGFLTQIFDGFQSFRLEIHLLVLHESDEKTVFPVRQFRQLL